MNKPKLSRRRMILAFAIAIIADGLQYPITAATATGILALPGEAADFALDCFVMILTSWLLGFHWVLLPSLIAELVPGLDLLPTWTGCVAFVIWQRQKERKPPAPTIIDIETVPQQPPPLPPSRQVQNTPKAMDSSLPK